jgi:hypothetical protein
MAKQLCGIKLLRGRTQQEVVNLLGEPDRRAQDHWEYQVDTGTAWNHNLVVAYEGNRVVSLELRD